jgi:hypothetical protein
MVKKLLSLLLIVNVALLSACSKGVPVDKRDFVGYWQSEKISLAIQVNGSMMYIDKTEAGKTKSLQGNISSFDAEGFVLGYPPFDTRFNVSKPPYQDGASKKMIVNGVELQQYQEPPEGQHTFSL